MDDNYVLVFGYVKVSILVEERLPQKNFGMVSTWKKKKRKTLNFVDAGSNNRDEREGN